MASVSTLEPTVDSPEVEQPAQSKGSKLPKPASKTLVPEDFYTYTAKLTEKDWAHAIIYVFRQYPRIIRDPKHIDKLSGAVTEEYILSSHGSGKYWIMLNDTDADRTVCQTYPDLDNPSFPPKIDLRELDVNHDKNRTFVDHLKRSGKLSMDGEVVSAKSENADATMAQALKDVALEAMRGRGKESQGLESQAFGKMMDMMSNASSKSIEIALGQLKKDEKTGADPMMVLIMQFMMKQLEVAQKPASTDNATLTVLTRMLDAAEKRAEAAETRAVEDRKEAAAERQRQHELQLKALEQRGDPMDMIDKVLSIKERLGGDEPDSRNWKEKLVDQGFQALPEVLTVLKGYATAKAAAPPQNYPRPQQQGPQPQNQPIQQPAGEVIEMPQQPQQTIDPEIAFLLQIFQAQGRQFVAAFINDPNSGPDVARTVALFAGQAVYERIARMGVDKILETIAMIPPMQQDLANAGTPEMLRDFIDGFINGDDEDDDDEDDPAIPEGRGRKKESV